MKIAVILTGKLRTIKKTASYLKQNVLLDDNVHICSCIQNDTSQTEEEWNMWFSDQFGNHLKSTTWFALDKYPEWVTHRDHLLEQMDVSEAWKNYLRTSGSMIEYFQLYLAYIKLCSYEKITGQYDYIIRTRTDTIYNKLVDFHWLQWTDKEIETRVNSITSQLILDNIDTNPKTVLMYFMTTIISDDLIPNIKQLIAEYCPCSIDHVVNPSDSSKLGKYIREGRYILTIRKNNLYLVRRNLFHFIPSLGMIYGSLSSPYSDDNYWFNAECQFRSACYHSCLSIFEYNTLQDDKSLENESLWDEKDFFIDGICNPKMLYCVVRK